MSNMPFLSNKSFTGTHMVDDQHNLSAIINGKKCVLFNKEKCIIDKIVKFSVRRHLFSTYGVLGINALLCSVGFCHRRVFRIEKVCLVSLKQVVYFAFFFLLTLREK